MKNNPFIRDAIDESLSGVRFDAQDMRSVLRAVRSREQTAATHKAPRMPFRPDFAFAVAMALILVVPLGLFTLRAQGLRTTSIVTAPGLMSAAPQATLDPNADLTIAAGAPARSAEESEAIQIARACFEEHCDTEIFTFEEYAVSVSASGGEYTVTMESVYGNGCAFTAVVSLPDGAILRHSTPRLATVPTFLNMESPEIKAWYDKHGPYLFTWPQTAQAEFSRRYEGAALRTARAGEITAEEAACIAQAAAEESFGLETGVLPYAYPVLYAGQNKDGSDAAYVVYCFAEPVADSLPTPGYIVSLSASTGDVISVSEN